MGLAMPCFGMPNNSGSKGQGCFRPFLFSPGFCFARLLFARVLFRPFVSPVFCCARGFVRPGLSRPFLFAMVCSPGFISASVARSPFVRSPGFPSPIVVVRLGFVRQDFFSPVFRVRLVCSRGFVSPVFVLRQGFVRLDSFSPVSCVHLCCSPVFLFARFCLPVVVPPVLVCSTVLFVRPFLFPPRLFFRPPCFPPGFFSPGLGSRDEEIRMKVLAGGPDFHLDFRPKMLWLIAA